MKKRKQVVAWVEMYEDKPQCFHLSKATAKIHADGYYNAQARPLIRLVKLVEHDPAVDAVVKAAKAVVYGNWSGNFYGSRRDVALREAVERLERKGER